MHNPQIEQVRYGLKELANNTKLHPSVRERLRDLLQSLDAGVAHYEDALEQLEMLQLRLPGFPGDEVGYPADD